MSFPQRLEPTGAHYLADGTWPERDVQHVHLSLKPTLDAPVLARQSASLLFVDRLSAAEQVDAMLMLSELVTNAVRHPIVAASATVDVHLAVAARRLRIEVHDGGEGFDVFAQAPSRAGGLGLVIVDGAASRWGVSDGTPHCVWLEMDREEALAETA